ncbi:putative membrane protein [Sphingobacterium faecium PCAi_F2.5]|nr:putative membrane protein [Sphingobacterium faecium PCAi_F2.5]
MYSRKMNLRNCQNRDFLWSFKNIVIIKNLCPLSVVSILIDIDKINNMLMNQSYFQKVSRIALGTFLMTAGISHLTFARKEFRAQVPNWVPLKKDDTVVFSGLAEISLGAALIFTNEKHRETVGQIAAGFFTSVFPGNIAQYVEKRDAFGLDTNAKRFARLFFQPVLIAWALASTKDNKSK